MTDFNRIMASYESIHRSPANRALHAIGIPMIAISALGMLSLVRMSDHGAATLINGAAVAVAAASLVVTRWSVRAGIGFLAFSTISCGIADAVATQCETAYAVTSFAATFVAGWAVQFVGHVFFERRAPQFTRRPENLLLGPVMIVAEVFPALRRSDPAMCSASASSGEDSDVDRLEHAPCRDL